MAGEGLLYRHGHQDLRLHPSDVCPVLAGSQEQGGGVRRGGSDGGERGAARQLHDKEQSQIENIFAIKIRRQSFIMRLDQGASHGLSLQILNFS